MPDSEEKIAILSAAIEAVLFTYGEPISIAKLAKIIPESGGPEYIPPAIANLTERLQKSKSGLTIISRGDEVQLVTRPDLRNIVDSLIKEEFSEELTPAALETLAIVIYGGEVPRSTVDYIRGVNSSFIVRNLLVRGLLDRTADPKRGNAYRYRPSFALLRHLGVDRPETLADYAKFRDMLLKFAPPN
ncbi:MAG: SMC-Scp complex subunit ScpB [Patescibacteria group bacterium]